MMINSAVRGVCFVLNRCFPRREESNAFVSVGLFVYEVYTEKNIYLHNGCVVIMVMCASVESMVF